MSLSGPEGPGERPKSLAKYSGSAILAGMTPELLQKRREAKPLLFVQTAVLIASSAGDLAELLRMLIGRKRAPRRLPPGPLLGEWLTLYRRHRRLADAMSQSQMGGLGMSASKVQDALRELARMWIDLGPEPGVSSACGGLHLGLTIRRPLSGAGCYRVGLFAPQGYRNVAGDEVRGRRTESLGSCRHNISPRPGRGGGRPDGRFLRPCRGGCGYYDLAFYPGVPLRVTPGYIHPPLRGETNRENRPAGARIVPPAQGWQDTMWVKPRVATATHLRRAFARAVPQSLLNAPTPPDGRAG